MIRRLWHSRFGHPMVPLGPGPENPCQNDYWCKCGLYINRYELLSDGTYKRCPPALQGGSDD